MPLFCEKKNPNPLGLKNKNKTTSASTTSSAGPLNLLGPQGQLLLPSGFRQQFLAKSVLTCWKGAPILPKLVANTRSKRCQQPPQEISNLCTRTCEGSLACNMILPASTETGNTPSNWVYTVKHQTTFYWLSYAKPHASNPGIFPKTPHKLLTYRRKPSKTPQNSKKPGKAGPSKILEKNNNFNQPKQKPQETLPSPPPHYYSTQPRLMVALPS